MNTVIRHLRRAALRHPAGHVTDGQLLAAFVERRDEAAFEALVRRLGPVVLGVCRRVLRNPADVDDAFQATFVLLVRKAAAVRRREKVGNWLYGVAYRTALKARTMSAKRTTKERLAPPPAPPDRDDELLRHLDAELNALPEKYRDVVVLCDLEGKSRKEAGQVLGLPEGTVSSRLTTARRLLSGRMAKYGRAVSAGALATLLAEAASAGVPNPLLSSTVRAACGVVPAPVAALVQGVLKAMLLTKLKVAAWVALVSLSVGAAALAQTFQGAGQESRSEPRRSAGDELHALRLEIEALRLDMKAMRERVNHLEEAAKSRPASAPGGTMKGFPGMPPGMAVPGNPPRAGAAANDAPAGVPNAANAAARIEQLYGAGYLAKSARDLALQTMTPDLNVSSAIEQAEAALKKIRETPNDPRAVENLARQVESLGRALQQKQAGKQLGVEPRKN